MIFMIVHSRSLQEGSRYAQNSGVIAAEWVPSKGDDVSYFCTRKNMTNECLKFRWNCMNLFYLQVPGHCIWLCIYDMFVAQLYNYIVRGSKILCNLFMKKFYFPLHILHIGQHVKRFISAIFFFIIYAKTRTFMNRNVYTSFRIEKWLWF